MRAIGGVGFRRRYSFIRMTSLVRLKKIWRDGLMVEDGIKELYVEDEWIER